MGGGPWKRHLMALSCDTLSAFLQLREVLHVEDRAVIEGARHVV